MVPSFFVTLETMPLTPNGKIDRRALVGWVERSETHLQLSSKNLILPRTEEEELLANIWTEILGIERIGIHDNFFELGGHSLLATQVISRIRDTFDIELPLRHFFESPTITALNEQLNTARHQSTLPPIRPINRDQPLPLSFAQQRLWFFNQLEGPSPTYNVPLALHLEGQLQQNALEQSLQALVQRHENLRTAFPTVNGIATVQISKQPFQLDIIDLRTLSPEEQAIKVQQLVKENVSYRFDLETGPLFRAVLLQLKDESHILLLNMHHIISDEWSHGILVREWRTFYEAFLQGKPSPLSPLPIQYIDFAHWQRQWLTGVVLEQQVAYWKQQLAGAPALLEMPTDYPRKPEQNYQGVRLPIEFGRELTTQLKQLSRQTGTTLFMVLWSAFATLLSRYTGQSDIVIGSPIANRTHSQTESLIGFFVNTLVLRLELSNNPPFEHILHQARRVALEAYTHQDIPFERLVEELNPERSLSYSPLFQVMLALQNTPMSSLELPELRLTPVKMENVVAKFDLTLDIDETAEGLLGEIEYDTELFELATIKRMIGHLKSLLTGLVANPQQRLHELPLLTEAEQQQLLTWNQTTVPYPSDKTVIDLFEEQVTKTPEALAVIFEDQQLTYQEFNIKANRLAHYLQHLGVKPEVLVGICLERSIEMAIGIFGTLKAGGAYLPLDPASPAARLRFVLEEAQVPILLTQKSLISQWSELQTQPVCLDVETEISHYRSENPVAGVKPDNLAYVIYTSGSTGTPKGVMLEHRGLFNHIYAKIHHDFYLTATDIIAQTAPITFDISVWQFITALLTGGHICIFNQEVITQPVQLLKEVVRQGITILEIVPSVLRAMLEEIDRTGERPNLSAIRWLLLTGEALPPKLCAEWLAIYPNLPILNAYGPTECSDDVSYYQIEKPPSSNVNQLPIGKPINNLRFYILDGYLQSVAVGIAGELYIGGIGVGRGYLNAVEKTAQAFLPDPFSEEKGARFYKTGDLVRYLPDGHIEYLGRTDNQVKIRGFRIELGEIEAVLEQYSSVKENAVVVHEASTTDKRLVAYIVLHSEQLIENKALREFLKERLPAYMIPSNFVILEALPLTPNGKIDRKTLSQLSVDSYQLSKESSAPPQTPAEKLLADIWADVLKIPQVSIHDNFFEVGGDSIISIQVISRANQVGLQLTPRQLFQHQTITELARVVNTTTTSSCQAEQGLVTGSVPFTPIQHWFFEQQLPEAHHYNQSVLLEVSHELQPEQLEIIISQLLQHHDALRLRFLENNQQQVITDKCSLFTDKGSLITVTDLSELTVTEQSAILESITAELQASLNLTEGPLLQVALFQLGHQAANCLFFAIHHLAIDGVSWRILLEDFAAAWQQLSRGETITLPLKTTSFQQWAKHLVEYAVSDSLVAELDEWLIEAYSQVKPLPVDYPAKLSANIFANVSEVTVSLNVEQTRALLSEVPKAYRTQINDVLLTALVQSFAKWTGEPVLLIELEGHGREELFDEVDLSRTVGWFTSVFPVLLDLRTVANDAGAALKTIKEQLRRIPRRGIGYGLLRYLNTDTASRLQALPQAQVTFNYLGQFQSFSVEPLLGLVSEDSEADSGALNSFHYLLDINGLIHDNQLHISWSYSGSYFQKATIERLAQNFINALQTLIAHCQLPEVFGYTPSDFPLAHLQQATLDKIIGQHRVDDLYPLSPMQEGMLFHTLYEPEAGLYFDQLLFTIEGTFNVAAWQQAWQQVTERHAVLRTACVWDGLKKPLQLVFSKVQVPWIKQDWRGLNKSQQQEQLTTFLHTEKVQGADLTVAPLMRCALIQLKDNQYHFIWTYHHLLLDGWAEPIILTDLIAFYESNCQGSSIHLAPVPLYRDYIAWLQQQDMKSAQTFWQAQLAGFSTPTPFGVDKLTNKAEVETQYGEQIFHLSSSTTAALQSLAKTHHFTLNTLVQGAWALLLSRYSGENDVVFGATVSGRPTTLAGVESMVGLFINTLPMRVLVSPDALLLPWLKELYTKQIEFDEYSYTPLVEIQGWSEVQSGIPLFDSLLVFENYPVDESINEERIGSLSIHSVQAIEKTNYPFLLEVAVVGSELRFNISYNLSRFEANTVSRMMGHLRTLLEGMIIEPETKRLGDIPLLTKTEQQQFLAWNETATDYPHDKTLVDLFEGQVDKTPEAVAVVFENQQLTYQDLNTKANQLGHYLQTLGIKPEVLVGICVERSFSLIIGLLGILKAGGAYLPLDPSYPDARLAFMLEDAQTPVLLTQSSLTQKLPKTTALTILLDVEIETLSRFSQENPDSGLKPENLAYVIYTSGSTGKPKGTLIIHQGLVNYLSWSVDTYQVAQGLGAPVHSSLGFDATITSLFSPLLAGQRILLLPDEQEVEAVLTAIRSFCDWSLVKITPAHLEILNTLLSEEQLSGKTRFLILGGEALPSPSLSLWRTFAPDTRIINEYGPTETVVGCCIYEVDAKTPHEGIVPIGYPIANTQLYILNNFLQRVPIGVSGELHIGGEGIARGYLNRPELTAEKFIKNPFSDDSNARLYKTGDLARYLPNGNIEYLGRIDNQVKIRGFRIELGEIEAVLRQHSAVRENAIIVLSISQTDKRLVAYVVPHQGQTIDHTALRSFLNERLPDYMIPSAWVTLDVLPLTPNGKIDRHKLVKWVEQGETHQFQLSEENFIAPRTPEEELLAGIWANILNIPTSWCSMTTFFELGGHSLLATQVMSRIRDTFAVELPVRELFESPTITTLSTRINTARQKSPLPPITPINREESLPLSFAQQRLWFLNQLEGPSATYNIADGIAY
jgi:amino acid adenylation domain-containing protein/non-ribosomal peptide synthase protein (TIGR01720 family)